jgi:hypothetical protein
MTSLEERSRLRDLRIDAEMLCVACGLRLQGDLPVTGREVRQFIEFVDAVAQRMPATATMEEDVEW